MGDAETGKCDIQHFLGGSFSHRPRNCDNFRAALGAAIIVEHQEVESEREAEQYRSLGFRPTPLEALDVWDAQQREFAELAAERSWQVAHGQHSERAQTEIAHAEAVAVDHLPSMPVTPIVKRQPRAANAAQE